MERNNAPQPRTVVLSELIEELCRLTETDSATAKAFTLDFFTTLEEALSAGETVTIKGIGRFSYEDGNVMFTADTAISEAVNEPFSMFEPVELAPGVPFELPEEETVTIAETELPEEADTENAAEDMVYHEAVTNETETEAEAEAESTDMVTVSETEMSETVPTEEPITADEPQTVDESEFTADTAEVVESIHEGVKETATEGIAEPPKDNSAPGLTTREPMLVERIHIKEIHRGLNKSSAWLLAILMFVAGWVACIFIQPILINLYNSYTYSTLPEVRSANSVQKLKQPADTTSVAVPITEKTEVSETPAPATKEVYDTITAKRYLTTIARDHYGSRDKWVIIYEANKDVISNPDVIAPGTIVRIPPLDTEK